MSLTERRPVPATPLRTGPARPLRVLAAATVAPLIRWIVAADSVPGGTERRTGCDECGTPIGLAGPLRALSPLARCGTCGHRIGAPPATVELALLVSIGVLALAARPASETVAFAWWVLCVLPLFFVDLAVHRLPDRLTYAAAFGTWGLLGLAALSGGTETAGGTAWVRSVLAGLAVAFVFAASTVLLGRRGFGLGDAKLALSSAAVLGWFGWEMVFFGLMVAFVAAALTSVVLLVAGRVRWSGHLPFGPFLILGSLVTLTLT
ncbi:prepilin peptidase [Micromonospora sp. NBC_01796]|uniref:prepilin peptidase n=1 Tax=Micromonospora sp. NBC_01796 TaxID=2975987 RepID=UPI002DD818A5|nr:A24 family peptidase [Micromonospora sp. NBC_01796]WSA88863.1 A24 family peptidase [Micromonospora sp. NBC_01796]